MYYALFAFGLPIILVILTYKNKLTGLPSYYLKGTTEGVYHIKDKNLLIKNTPIFFRHMAISILFAFVRWLAFKRDPKRNIKATVCPKGLKVEELTERKL
jgi:hypothetical protein